jgi:glutathione S-transferase
MASPSVGSKEPGRRRRVPEAKDERRTGTSEGDGASEAGMAITFYWGSGSPPSWRAMLALEHKKLAYDSRLLSFAAGDLKKPEYLAINPRGKVPAIVDDGFALYESVAIMEYLDARYPDSGSPLYPRDAAGAARVRRTIQEIDHYLVPPGTRLFRQAFGKPEDRDPKESSDARATLRTELAGLERRLDEVYLAGSLSAADFALYPSMAALLRVGLKHPAYSLEADIGPNLSAWMKRIESLDFYEKTYPPHWR